jgi:hypothetical protein
MDGVYEVCFIEAEYEKNSSHVLTFQELGLASVKLLSIVLCIRLL